jgi:hypothetical protein
MLGKLAPFYNHESSRSLTAARFVTLILIEKGIYGLLFLAAGRREEPAHFRQVGGWERGNVGSVIGGRMVILQMLI